MLRQARAVPEPQADYRGKRFLVENDDQAALIAGPGVLARRASGAACIPSARVGEGLHFLGARRGAPARSGPRRARAPGAGRPPIKNIVT